MSWNHRLIRMKDGSLIMAEVYYEEDRVTPAMYADCRDIFYCDASEDYFDEWETLKAQYDSAFQKPIIDEWQFHQETGFAESLADVMKRGLDDAKEGRVTEWEKKPRKQVTVSDFFDEDTGTTSETRVWLFGEESIRKYEQEGFSHDLDYGLAGDEIDRLNKKKEEEK